jgi:hypothetical protein
MSHSPAIGVFSVKVLAYIGRQMAGDLSRVGDGVLTETKDLKSGVVADARRFFASVMEEICFRNLDRIPANPPASIAHYGYAMQAFPGASYEELAALAIFVGSLARERRFNAAERRAAYGASAFFLALGRLG